MGGPALAMPIVFLKPASCAVFAKKQQGGQEGELPLAVVKVPRDRGSCHYETELVLRVGADGRTFDAVTIGLDLTLRDVQNECKKTGHPCVFFFAVLVALRRNKRDDEKEREKTKKKEREKLTRLC